MSQQTSTPSGTSPGRRTRLQEKEELQHLNDRFITYIDRVRKLRDEQQRLNVTLEQIQTTTEEESVSIKRVFEQELQDARLLIDETAKEKARFQILASKNEERVRELEAELKEIQEELTNVQQDLLSARKNAETLDSLYKSAVNEKQFAQQKVQDLEEELDELRNRLKELQETLERETLAKVDLQNQIQSLREDMAFKRKVYDEEITTLRRTGFKVYSDGGGIEETDDDFAEKLRAAIDEAREEIEKETDQYKIDLERTYKSKIELLENQSIRDSSTITRLDSELKSANTSLAKARRDISKLQEENERLEGLLREKDDANARMKQTHAEEMSRLKQTHADEISSIMDEMRSLRANYDKKIFEYEELLGLRVQLEQEIATLSALLQEEEIRLNLNPTPTREKRPRPRDSEGPRLKKTKKVAATSSSAAGFIQICDVDPDGRFVQIKNMSDKIEALGGFKIVHEVETTGEKVEFRFHSKSKLQGGASVTVWAAGVDGATHAPPTDIIWKSVSNWGSGPKTLTSLCTKSGEVVATFTQTKEDCINETVTTDLEVDETDVGVQTFPSIPTTTPTRVHSEPRPHRPTTSAASSDRNDQLFHQQGENQGQMNGHQNNCIIS